MEAINKQPPTPKLRYTINAYLMALPAGRRAIVKRKIRKQCNGIAESTLSRWINLTQTDSADIPASALVQIADILNVDIEDLFTSKK